MISTGNDNRNDKSGMMSLDGMIFGMPPRTYISDDLMRSTMPVATIMPCEPDFSQGLSLFRLNNSTGATFYRGILNSVGFNISTNFIKVVYMADNFPTDTFINEYGETFLDAFAQTASSAMGDVAQIFGWNSFQDVQAGAMAGANIVGAKGIAETGIDMIDSVLSNMQKNMTQSQRDTASKVLKTAGSVATGARVDFPQVWKNSNFTPSYSMTIRLYNPNPSKSESTRRYIVGPIAALLALAIPKVTEDGATYKWPLICKVRSPGIYDLNAGFIQSISIVKGGDQQSIGYNQTLGMCDVRIEFGSLYNSILGGPGSETLGDKRPTLGTYLEAIGGNTISGDAKLKEVSLKDIKALNDKKEAYSFSNEKRNFTIPRTAEEPNAQLIARMNKWNLEQEALLKEKSPNNTVNLPTPTITG